MKTNSIARHMLAIIFLASFSTLGFSQSLPNLALTRLNYTVTKRRVNLQGELKQKIDAVDKDLAEATRLGRTADRGPRQPHRSGGVSEGLCPGHRGTARAHADRFRRCAGSVGAPRS